MLSTQTFDAVTRMFEDVSGIRLGAAKRALVTGRLQRMAQDRDQPDVDAYVRGLLQRRDPAEIGEVVDRLTTNETYFFREPKHFEALVQRAQAHAVGGGSQAFRVWSAASSSGEEAYSIAMVLADRLGSRPWEVVGTDLSSAMVRNAQRALYPLDRARDTPPELLRKHCRRGEGRYEGQFLVSRELRQRVGFQQANLTEKLPEIGFFDVIFLRNVLIYFDVPGKIDIVRRVATRLKPGGQLYTGHAESLNGMDTGLRQVRTAVYEAA